MNDETNVRRLERGIYNYSLEKAEEHNIVKVWDDPLFKQI